MRFAVASLRSALFGMFFGTALAAAGCSESTPQAFPASIPHMQTKAVRPAWYRSAPFQIDNVVYVAAYYNQSPIDGYDYWKTRQNLPPVCSIPGSYVINIATDPAGDLIDPDGGSRKVKVFRGPGACGSQIGQFTDDAGQPSDAASWNAKTGTIYVGNIQAAGRRYGNVSVCTIASGCTGVLSNPSIGGQLFGVAEDKGGTVYASGRATPSGTGAALVLWKNGSGPGTRITAYRNSSPGGLEVDPGGNILALDTFASELWIYSGCPDRCTAHGPFSLKGQSIYGRVNAADSTFQAADFEYGQVDVYKYRGLAGVTYLYSYNAGLNSGDDVEGIAIDPGAD